MKRVNREGRPFRDKNLCRKGKPCGSVCIPRNKKCKDGSQEVRQKQSDGGAIKNLLASPAYHALLSRKGLVGGSAGVISILGGAGTVVALDLQKISRTTKQGMEAAQPPPPVETFQPGDLIRKQTVFAGVTAHHYAVYVGRDERTGEHQVIQCQADPSYQEAASRITRSVITQKDRYFSVPRDEMYKKRGSREFSRDEIIRRAEALVGTGYTYRPFSSNCENFARGMVEGVGYSTQGEAVSALTMRVADTFAHVGTVLAKKGYLKSRNRKNAQQMLEYLDSMRGSEFSFRQDSVIENTNGNQGVLKRLDYINTLALVPPEESPASEIDLFCDQAGLKRPSKYAELISALSSPLGGLKLSVQQKMLGDYSRMFFGLINLEEVLSSSRKKLDSVGAGRHPPPAPPASSSLSHRKIRSDSLVMNKTIASLSLSDIAMEISASHDIAVDEIYDTEIRTDGSLAGIASSGGTFFEFDINSRSVGVVERPDLTASANERARGSLSAMGIDYRGDSAFEYLRGLESRMDGPFGAVRRAGSAVGGAVRRVAGGQCGRGWKPGPGGKCVRGGGMGRGAKIGAGIAAVGALGAGAVALNRARNKPKALPAAGQTGAGQSSLARYSTTRALQGRVRQGIGAAKGAIGAAKGAIGGAVQKFRTPSPAPAGTRPRRKNPTRTYTVDKIDNPKRTDSTRMDGPFGARNGKCGRGWEPGPGGKCVRSRGGGMGRGAKIGAGIAAVGALGAGAVALNRARNKPKALPAAGQTGRDNQLSRYSRATAMKGKIRQGIQKGVGRVKSGVQRARDVVDLTRANSKKMPGTNSTVSSYKAPRY